MTLTQSQRIAWCAWAGTYWREVAIRDMVLPSLVVTPALPPGWDAVVATPGITWEPAYQQALTSMWHRPVTMVTGAAGTGKTTLIRSLATSAPQDSAGSARDRPQRQGARSAYPD